MLETIAGEKPGERSPNARQAPNDSMQRKQENKQAAGEKGNLNKTEKNGWLEERTSFIP